MNVPKSLASSLTWRWVLLLLGAALLLSVAFIWLRGEERGRLDAAARIVRNYGRATDDLNTGFLHITLGARDEGPWDRARGIVLLNQALRELEAATLGLPQGDELIQRFRQDLATFEGLLRAEEAKPGTLTREVALQLALSKLKATADEVDAHLRSDQQQANDRFDRNFFMGLVAGLLALAVLAALTLRTLSAQQRVTRQLQESESKFRGLVEQSIAGVMIVQDGIVFYANPRAAEIFGRRLDALVGMSIVELVPERYRAECASIATRLMGDPSDSFSGALTGLLPDGREIRLEVQANPMRINNAPAVLGIMQDVTERHRLDTERIEALQLLESISRSSGDAVFAKDLNGRMKLFNAQAERISGYSAREVLGRDDFATLPPEEARRTMADDQLIIREKKVQRAEWTLPSPNGVRTLDVVKGPLYDKHGRVTGLFGVARDITERKREEQALQESRAELEAVIDALDEGLVVYALDGHILRMNPAARRIAGLDFDPSKGMSSADRKAAVSFETLEGQPIPFEDWPAQRVLRGERVRNLECVLVNAGAGIRRTLNCSSGLVRDAGGQIRLGLLTFMDITERRNAEMALMQSQRLESLGTLAAGIAHDFNNILLAIVGNATLAEADLPLESPAHTSLQEVLRASQRAKDLVRRILLFARAEDAQRHTGDLREVVSEAVELMRPSLPARVQLQRQLPESAVNVDMDASQIHQVVVNLVTNSGHAIEDIGPEQRGQVRVVLETLTFDSPRQIGLRLLPAGAYARIEVADEGCGMDPAVIARVFDPFFTTKSVGRGTGLGLAIVRGIVEDHRGSIELQSEKGKGTSVRIYLPLSASKPLQSPAASDAPKGSGHHVLYIDDEPALVSLVTRYLQRQGYKVTGNTDAGEALDAFRAAPGEFDLVVTDLSMPEMSGFDVVQAVRSVSQSVPIIMMSGYVRPEDREKALAMGVKEVLLKPSTVSDLCESIDRELR